MVFELSLSELILVIGIVLYYALTFNDMRK
jgi:hypothetical protein